MISDRLPVCFANALLKELKKIIDAIKRSVVPQLFSAANRNPWFAKKTHGTDFFVFYRINLFNFFAQILMIIYVFFILHKLSAECGLTISKKCLTIVVKNM